MKIAIISILFCSLSVHAFAQTDNDKNKIKVNSIKKSNSYLYGEATLAIESEAYELANELLVNSINEWVVENKKMKNADNLVVKDITKQSEFVGLKRGNMYRAFVFVKKSDIIPIYDTKGLLVLEKEPTAKISDEMKTIEVDEVEIDTSVESRNEILDEVLVIKLFHEIQPFFEKLKKEGRMIGYGKYATMTSPELCYLLVYNTKGEVKAVLSKEENGRINLVTQLEDNTNNYKGCGAIWFQLAE